MSKDRRRKILVLAGHGGRDKGAIHPDGKTFETDITIPAASTLALALTMLGHDVAIAPPDDLAPKGKFTIKQRVAWAKDEGGDLLISIHANACKSHSAEGSEVLYYRQGRPLAALIAPVIAMLPRRDRGPKRRTDLPVLRDVPMPAVLLELGFVDDNDKDDFDDRQWLLKHWPEQIGRTASVADKWIRSLP